MSPIERYLTEMRAIRATGAGAPETSFYPPLAALLNEIGRTLKPKVVCIVQLSSRGAGMPDMGLFTADQLRRGDRAGTNDPWLSQLPARGVVEIKSPAQDLNAIVESEQIEKYWMEYGLVLVTNYRGFALVGKGPDGKPSLLERYEMAKTESAFWNLVSHPHKTADEQDERLVEYLKRVLLHGAPLGAPRDVAALLASYARDARSRVETADLPALTGIRTALEEALGLKFEGNKGERFFRSTLIQTIFYGVFSAWVLWAKRKGDRAAGTSFKKAIAESSVSYGENDHFHWRSAAWSLRVPMIRALFEQIATPTLLGPLGLVEILDWTAAALNRVDRDTFFSAFDEGHAVQYFYEPFLEEFDPVMRKELGVWYTPVEIVRYMVARVDTVLREELHIADGLADPRVVVLDPCCGTGAYLVETLHRIHATLREKGEDALAGQELKRAAMERIYGFEILPAPFVISHLQLGLFLQSLGAPFSDVRKERAGIFLTNALTGWEPPKEPKTHLLFPELEEERDAAEKVKREAKILVILGNPPYNAFAGVSPEEEQGLVEPYKEGLASHWGIRKFNLDDLYVRFFRLAEKRIAEHGEKRGVVCFISNFSYLSDPSFVVMRKRFLGEFDVMWFDCLNGDSRETGKLTPEGEPDPSVFSTEYNRAGIRVGTTVGLLVKKGAGGQKESAVRFQSFWGASKRQDIFNSLEAPDLGKLYHLARPDASNRFSFRPTTVSGSYLSWPRLVDLSSEPPINGLMEKRGGALMDMNPVNLSERMKVYFDPSRKWEELATMLHPLTHEAAGFDPPKARNKLLTAEKFSDSRVMRYALRPFDDRWCYYSNTNPLWNRARPSLRAQSWSGNSFLLSRPARVSDPEGTPFFYTTLLGDNDFMRGHAYYFPLRLRSRKSDEREAPSLAGFVSNEETTANLSSLTRNYLSGLGIKNPDDNAEIAEAMWFHALAIGYSPLYLNENADGIRQDWPRIPLPDTKALLLTSADLGRQIALLLDTETQIPGITTGTIRPELRDIAKLERIDGKPINPDTGDFDLTAGWGHKGKNEVTMPGRGKIEDSGEGRYSVYLNDIVCWKNVPAEVWEYTIGGYQVVKKWLSYREKGIIGRGLTLDEVREVTQMIRRLYAIVLLHPALDEDYQNVRDSAPPA